MLHFVTPISCASIIAWMVVMTLALAFKGSEGVVLAADSRVTFCRLPLRSRTLGKTGWCQRRMTTQPNCLRLPDRITSRQSLMG